MQQPDIWAALSAPFDAAAVKERQGPKQHQGACEKQYGQCKHQHKMLSYVDARDVEARLDDVLTPAGWDFQATIVANPVVQGRLIVYASERAITREDFGYPNGDDDAEPIKSAVSDALKRCAVQLGVGRHLYTDNKAPRRAARTSSRPAQEARQNAPQAQHEKPANAPVNHQPGGSGMTVGQALDAIKEAGIDARTVSAKGKELYGKWALRDMTAEQRAHVVEELLLEAGASSSPASTTPTAPDADDMWAGIDTAAA